MWVTERECEREGVGGARENTREMGGGRDCVFVHISISAHLFSEARTQLLAFALRRFCEARLQLDVFTLCRICERSLRVCKLACVFLFVCMHANSHVHVCMRIYIYAHLFSEARAQLLAFALRGFSEE